MDDEYYFSDLTDLGELSENSETQETRPAKKKAKGNLRLKAKSPEFTIRGALKPGRMTTCSTEALYSSSHHCFCALQAKLRLSRANRER
jgi:hypothetical protein